MNEIAKQTDILRQKCNAPEGLERLAEPLQTQLPTTNTALTTNGSIHDGDLLAKLTQSFIKGGADYVNSHIHFSPLQDFDAMVGAIAKSLCSPSIYARPCLGSMQSKRVFEDQYLWLRSVNEKDPDCDPDWAATIFELHGKEISNLPFLTNIRNNASKAEIFSGAANNSLNQAAEKFHEALWRAIAPRPIGMGHVQIARAEHTKNDLTVITHMSVDVSRVDILEGLLANVNKLQVRDNRKYHSSLNFGVSTEKQVSGDFNPALILKLYGKAGSLNLEMTTKQIHYDWFSDIAKRNGLNAAIVQYKSITDRGPLKILDQNGLEGIIVHSDPSIDLLFVGVRTFNDPKIADCFQEIMLGLHERKAIFDSKRHISVVSSNSS